MANSREHFGSRFAAIMAMAGSAIGLGNIWRFPYMVGQHGGAAFIIVYLISALFLSLPIFLSESIIGRSTHLGTYGAMQKLAPGTGWKWLGLLTVASPLIILSYYSVVGGWSLEYLLKSLSFSFTSEEIRMAAASGGEAELLAQSRISELFGGFISSTWGPIFFHTVFILICGVIVVAGVKNGIEKFAKITTPILFVLILIIMVYSCSLPGAGEGVRYLIKPDFSKLDASAIASAMGQSFFSLSLGVGTILTYSSYVSKDEDLIATGVGTSIFDLVFALIAGFAIMPAVFAAGIEPGAGPGLIFETLPFIFAKMGVNAPWLSGTIAILFFVTILFAALTSAISMYETGVAYLIEEHGCSRVKSTAMIFTLCWLVGIFCSLSFGRLSDFHIFGETIFNGLDKFASNFLMPLGGLLFTIFVGWKLPKPTVRGELTCEGKSRFNNAIFPLVFFLIRYVAPVVIAIIFVTNLVL